MIDNDTSRGKAMLASIILKSVDYLMLNLYIEMFEQKFQLVQEVHPPSLPMRTTDGKNDKIGRASCRERV